MVAEPFDIEMGCGGCTWDIPRWKYNGTRGPVDRVRNQPDA